MLSVSVVRVWVLLLSNFSYLLEFLSFSRVQVWDRTVANCFPIFLVIFGGF